MESLAVSEFKSRLEVTLGSFDLDLARFGNFLRTTGSVLSGSSMLNVVKPFTDSVKDLDIYTTERMLNLWKAYLRAHGWTYDRDAYLHVIIHYRRGNRRRESPISGVYCFYKTVDDYRYLIDIIVSRTPDPLDCIRFFDFSMLLNWFDGQRLFCADPQAIVSKKPKINTTGNYIYGKRLVKYKRDRGYDIKTVDVGVSSMRRYVPENFLNESLSFADLVTPYCELRAPILMAGTVAQEVQYRIIRDCLLKVGLPRALIAYTAEFLFCGQFCDEPKPLFIQQDKRAPTDVQEKLMALAIA